MQHGKHRTNLAAYVRMKEDILLRGLSQKTLENYTLHVRIFLEYCNCPPEDVNEHDIRRFLLHLINEKKVSPGTVNTYSSSAV